MSTVTLDDFYSQGGGKIAYVFHIAGMPYAHCSTSLLTTQLPTGSAIGWIQDIRRVMFGDAVLSINSAAHYPADYVPILPGLDPDVGKQVIKYTETKGISVGSWSVKLSDNMQGYTFTDFDENPLGLPGLRWLKDPWADTTIKTAYIGRDYPTSTDTLYWERDHAGFKTYITTKQAANEPVFLWSGTSCLGISDNAAITDDPESEGAHCSALPGFFQTPKETIWRDVTTSYQNIPIYTAPVEGVVGMPCYLWGIPLDANGDIIDQTSEPILLRIGKVNGNPTGKPGEWNISCSGFTDLLKKKLIPSRWTAQLSGYSFCQQTATGGGHQGPHLYALEQWDTGNSNFDSDYLGSAGDYIRYETLNQVKAAAINLLNSMSVNFNYFEQDGDLVFQCNTTTYPNPTVYLGGVLPWLCGWGYLKEATSEAAIDNAKSAVPMWGSKGIFPEMGAYYLALRPYDSLNVSNLWGQDVENEPSVKYTGLAKYFYQCDFADDDFIGDTDLGSVIQAGDVSTHCWQIPEDESGDRKIYVTAESDTQDLKTNDYISIGNLSDKTALGGATWNISENISPASRYLVAKVATVDGTSGLWIETKDPSTVTNGYNDYGDDILSEEPGNGYVSRNGMNFCYLVNVHESDPWPIMDTRSATSLTPSELFRALLGDPASTVNLPRRIAITNIPFVRVGDDRTLIDWTKFDELTGASGLSGVDYLIELCVGKNQDNDLTILDALTNLCLVHGVRLVWEYNEGERSWWLSFGSMSNESRAVAQQAGRNVDVTTIERFDPSYVIGNDWIYSGINLNIKTKDGIEIKDTYKHATDKAEGSAQAKVLKIKDMLSRIPYDAYPTVQDTMVKYARIFATSAYTQKLNLDLKKLARISCGRSVLVTWAAAVDVNTGGYGLDNRQGLVTEETITLGSNPGCDITIRLSQRPSMGIGPSMYLDAADISLVNTTLSITGKAADQDFASPSGGLVDLALFDCYTYNVGTGEIELNSNCSCENYGVIVFRKDADTYTDSNPGRNVFHGTIGGINLTTGVATITLADATNFDAAKDHVCIFEDRDSANLQPCQYDVYGDLGDDEGIVTDEDAEEHRAIAWG